MPILERQSLFYQRIVHAVLIHRKAAECVQLFLSNFALMFSILIIIGVSSLSINLFQVTLINSISEDACIIFCLIILHIIYMFIINYGGQNVTNHGMEVFKSTYSGLWYTAPLHTQKMLLFVMQKGIINIDLRINRFYTASLEGFAMLVNTAVSYFIVIRSTRQ
ncbi:uncharacterized protein [Anoplolepis gracilipes]|uniref:uncharacterized protein n=1 Tax=Anoplolepis gracilipes TaxID=354296 RepID=UPI003BA1D832